MIYKSLFWVLGLFYLAMGLGMTFVPVRALEPVLVDPINPGLGILAGFSVSFVGLLMLAATQIDDSKTRVIFCSAAIAGHAYNFLVHWSNYSNGYEAGLMLSAVGDTTIIALLAWAIRKERRSPA